MFLSHGCVVGDNNDIVDRPNLVAYQTRVEHN